MSWLQQHLEIFVKPYLGFIPEEPLDFFDLQELSVIKSVWRSVKKAAKGKNLLLAGRDVFIFEVLARRENYPTRFMPECSRLAVSAIKLADPNVFLFDTGFEGSIPRALGLTDFALLSSARTERTRNDMKQVFPRLTRARGLALKIESTPKYWETGRLMYDWEPGEFPMTKSETKSVQVSIVQKYSRKEEFEKAAKLTIAIYKNSAPRFINKQRALGGLNAFPQKVF